MATLQPGSKRTSAITPEPFAAICVTLKPAMRRENFCSTRRTGPKRTHCPFCLKPSPKKRRSVQSINRAIPRNGMQLTAPRHFSSVLKTSPRGEPQKKDTKFWTASTISHEISLTVEKKIVKRFAGAEGILNQVRRDEQENRGTQPKGEGK